jgi:hypothetical protein
VVSLKVLDPEWPIREADIPQTSSFVEMTHNSSSHLPPSDDIVFVKPVTLPLGRPNHLIGLPNSLIRRSLIAVSRRKRDAPNLGPLSQTGAFFHAMLAEDDAAGVMLFAASVFL